MQNLLLGILTFLTSLFGTAGEVHDAPQDTPPVYPAEVTARVVRVIDGDTIDVEIERDTERVRYIGIDTPERNGDGVYECYGEEATARNRALVGEKEVRLVADKERRDDYGRLLRYVYREDTLVNRELLDGGYATLLFIPPNTRHHDNFKTVRDEARNAGRGLWSACK